MLRLPEMTISDDLQEKLLEKWEVYRILHSEEKVTLPEMAKIFLEFGIMYLDIRSFNR